MNKITILFGEGAVDLYNEKGKVTQKVKDNGSLQDFEFETVGEMNAFVKGLNAGQGWEDWVEVAEGRKAGKPEYIDEFPKLIEDEWETAMVGRGHNVTAHLNEVVPCRRCEEIIAEDDRVGAECEVAN